MHTGKKQVTKPEKWKVVLFCKDKKKKKRTKKLKSLPRILTIKYTKGVKIEAHKK